MNSDLTITFDGDQASAIITVADDTITLPSSGDFNALSTGDMVTYSDGGGGGVAIDGLTTAKSYYVVKAVSPKIKLASSYANAMAATPDVVALTTKAAAAGNSHTLTYEKTVDTTNNKIYLRANTYDALYRLG